MSRVFLLHTVRSPAHADDAGGNQFLNVGLDVGVAHVFLESSWVALCLLQDGLHDGICYLSVFVRSL